MYIYYIYTHISSTHVDLGYLKSTPGFFFVSTSHSISHIAGGTACHWKSSKFSWRISAPSQRRNGFCLWHLGLDGSGGVLNQLYGPLLWGKWMTYSYRFTFNREQMHMATLIGKMDETGHFYGFVWNSSQISWCRKSEFPYESGHDAMCVWNWWGFSPEIGGNGGIIAKMAKMFVFVQWRPHRKPKYKMLESYQIPTKNKPQGVCLDCKTQ